MFHYKYAFLLNVTSVTFIFGPAMPLMFVLAFLAMFIYYTLERCFMAYSYKKPPQYNSNMNQTTLKLMMACPFLYCLSAAWTYSN